MLTYAPLIARDGLGDVRLIRRLDTMKDQFTAQPDCPIPQATGGRRDMDATYDFFKNPRVRPEGIVSQSLGEVLPRLGGLTRVLVAQDTTDCNYASLTETTGLGYTDGSNTRGLLVHSSLAMTTTGLPLGLLTQQIWTRDPALKGKTKDRRKRDAEDKESYRWADHAAAARSVLPAELCVVHVADRESDIYDWMAAERPPNTHLLIRVAQGSRTVVHGPNGDEGELSAVVRAQTPLGRHQLEVPRGDGEPARPATVSVRVAVVEVAPPLHAKCRSQLPNVKVWVIEAWEEDPPAGEEALRWCLLTTEEVVTLDDAVGKLGDYALRWRIERFHFALKQGCKVEALQLDTAERLANAVAVYSQVAVRLLRLTYLGRQKEETPVEQEFTPVEVEVLDCCRQRQERRPSARVRTIREAIRVIAMLGGHLGRKGDGPPGVKTLWRGLRRLTDQVIGYQINRLEVKKDTRNE